MEVQIKKTVKAGNSSAVVLPRAWLNKEVRIELLKKTKEEMLEEIIEISGKYIPLGDVIGIYLIGSYAREEETERSDIDILILTDNIDKEAIKEGIYSILIVSEQLLKQKLEKDLFPLGQMLREAKALINAKYLEKLKIEVTKNNIRWYLETTEKKLELLRKTLEKVKNKADNRIIYTLILRIRTMQIIQKLVKNQDYSSKEFIKLINKVSGSKNAYQAYLAVKDESKDAGVGITAKEEAERLYVYLKKQFDDVKKLVGVR